MVNLAGPVLLTMLSKVMARLCLHLVFVVFCSVSLFRDLIIVDYHSPLDIMQLLAGSFLYAHHLLGDIFGTSHTSWSPGMLLGQSQFFCFKSIYFVYHEISLYSGIFFDSLG